MSRYKILFIAVIAFAAFFVTNQVGATQPEIPEPVKKEVSVPEPVKVTPVDPDEISFFVDVRFDESDDYFNQVHVLVKPVPGLKKKNHERFTWPEEIDWKKPPKGEMHIKEEITYKLDGESDLVQVQLWRLTKEKRPKWKTPSDLQYRVVSPRGPFNVSMRTTDLPEEDVFAIIIKPSQLNGKVIQIR
jgi:hypothetical protein